MTTVICFGDSNTWGYDPATGERFPADVRWPGVLRRRLPQVQIVEEGLCGRTTLQEDPFEEGRNGLTYLVPCLASHAPVDAVAIMLGTNDVKGFFLFDGAGIAAGAGRLVEVVQKSRCGPGGRAPEVLLVAPPPVAPPPAPLQAVWGFSRLAEERSLQLGRFYAAIAESTGCAFLDAGMFVAVSPVDGVHLEAAAHQALGEAIAERLARLIGTRG